jgi:hypothetical protein
VVTGAATLYRYQKVFYIEKENYFYELTNEKQYKTIDGKKVLVESKQYISILRFLLHDCGNFIEKISNSNFSEKALTNLIESYNACVGSSGITYKSQKPWVKSIVGITGGFKITRLNFFTNYTMHEHINHTKDRIITPLLGISLNIFSPRISERISFHNDFYYLTSNYNMYKYIDLGYRKRKEFVKIQLGQLSIATGFRYTGPEKRITPYYNFGMLNVFHTKSNSEWTREVDNISYLINHQALVIKGKQTGLWGGAGVIKSISPKLKILIDLRYEWTDGLSNYPRTGLKSAISNLQFTAGIITQ